MDPSTLDEPTIERRMRAWRHEIHAHPELAFHEHRTAAFVAARLREFGLDVVEGVGGTGVVGTLRLSQSTRQAIAFRAELDALPIQEVEGRPWGSVVPGVMHACGHDGHCAMLLGAAAWLAEHGGFEGTIHFVFQPAEENEGGARLMLQDGFFDRFPVDEVFALHTEPSLPIGHFAVASGAVMASMDLFDIRVTGEVCHAARPHQGADAILCAASLVAELQAVRTRALDPLEPGVVSVTSIEGGSSRNVLPEHVQLQGTARLFSAEASKRTEATIRRVAEGVAAAHGCEVAVEYERRYPAAVNAEVPSGIACDVAAAVAGAAAVGEDPFPLPASEDFAFFLEQRPGCLALLGNGKSASVHTPEFDFADDALLWGLRYWVALARTLLPADSDAPLPPSDPTERTD